MKYIKAKFKIKVLDDLYLPEYKGSFFRGIFGWKFKKLTCVLKNLEDCKECILKKTCPHFNIFENKYYSEKPLLKTGSSIPHPYIILPPLEEKRKFEKDETLEFEITLVGKWSETLPYFLLTFQEIGKSGIGKNKSKFEIEAIYQNNRNILTNNNINFDIKEFNFDNHSDVSNINFLTVELITPLRLMKNNKTMRNLSFKDFYLSVLRRVELLLYYYNDKSIDNFVNVKALNELAESIKVKSKNLYWYNWERYSNRQKKRISLSGLMGKISFEGNITHFLPLLKFTETFHTGKNTVFGLGKINIEINQGN
jgi:hypothetical protein